MKLLSQAIVLFGVSYVGWIAVFELTRLYSFPIGYPTPMPVNFRGSAYAAIFSSVMWVMAFLVAIGLVHLLVPHFKIIRKRFWVFFVMSVLVVLLPYLVATMPKLSNFSYNVPSVGVLFHDGAATDLQRTFAVSGVLTKIVLLSVSLSIVSLVFKEKTKG